MRALGELGLLGMMVPAAYGGAEAGPIALALALREIARGDASVGVTMSVTNMVAETLARFGTEPARQRYLPRLCSGEAVAGAFALSEAQAGSDPSAMTTTVERDAGGGYRIRGNKLWTTSGDRAGVLLVAARNGASLGRAGYSTFAVEQGTPGLTPGRHEDKAGLRGSSTVALTFDDVVVAADALVGNEGDGLKVALSALGGGRIGIAAQALGIARAAFDVACAYVRERRQFNRPLGDFQAVRFALADAAVGLDAGWLLTLAAAWRKQHGLPFSRQAAEAKLFATERANENLRPRRSGAGRIRLHARLSRRAPLPRRPRHHHLRRHEPDPAPGHRPGAAARGARGNGGRLSLKEPSARSRSDTSWCTL